MRHSKKAKICVMTSMLGKNSSKSNRNGFLLKVEGSDITVKSSPYLMKIMTKGAGSVWVIRVNIYKIMHIKLTMH